MWISASQNLPLFLHQTVLTFIQPAGPLSSTTDVTNGDAPSAAPRAFAAVRHLQGSGPSTDTATQMLVADALWLPNVDWWLAGHVVGKVT